MEGEEVLVLEVPVQRMIRFVGLAPSSETLDQLVSVGDMDAEATLLFGHDIALEIELSGDEDALASAWALVDYRGRTTVRIESQNGRLTVPKPEQAGFIRVFSRGCASVALCRSDEPSAHPGGRLALHLRPAVELSWRLVDLGGSSLPGMLVRLIGDAHARAFRRHPGLGGNLPTNHPAWWMRPEPNCSGLTDHEGRFVARGLVEGGKFDARADLPEALSRPDGVPSANFAARRQVQAERGAEMVWTLPPPRLLRLQVLDATNGLGLGSVPVDREGEASFSDAGRDSSEFLSGSLRSCGSVATCARCG